MVVLIGFLMRFYAAANVPIIHTEIEKLTVIQQIHFCWPCLQLPLGSAVTHNPLLLPYLMKISLLVFGGSALAARLPFVVLGTLTLPVLYFLIKKYFNQRAALISLFFLAFSNFHIGYTRIASESGILLFFTTCIMFLTLEARNSKNQVYLLWTSAFLGLGCLAKLTILTILPPIIYFLFLDSKTRGAFFRKDFFIFMFIVTLANLPNLYWNVQSGYANYYSYVRKIDFLSFSLVPWVLFLGEFIVAGMRRFDDSFFYLISSWEFPFLNWLMGLLCLSGVIYFLRNKKNDLIRLSLAIFIFNFILFSLVRPRTGGGAYFHLDNFWWAIASVIPGFILAAAMLADLMERYKIVRIVMPIMIIYFVINSFSFVNFPANCYVPRRSMQAKELWRSWEIYSQNNEAAKAQKVLIYMKRHGFDH